MTDKEIRLQLMLLGFHQVNMYDTTKWVSGNIKVELINNDGLKLKQLVNGQLQTSNYADAERALNYLTIIL